MKTVILSEAKDLGSTRTGPRLSQMLRLQLSMTIVAVERRRGTEGVRREAKGESREK